MQIGVLVHQSRKAQKLTQLELGQRTGISLQAVSAIERGLSQPSMETFAKLRKVLRFSHLEVAAVLDGLASPDSDVPVAVPRYEVQA